MNDMYLQLFDDWGPNLQLISSLRLADNYKAIFRCKKKKQPEPRTCVGLHSLSIRFMRLVDEIICHQAEKPIFQTWMHDAQQNARNGLFGLGKMVRAHHRFTSGVSFTLLNTCDTIQAAIFGCKSCLQTLPPTTNSKNQIVILRLVSREQKVYQVTVVIL